MLDFYRIDVSLSGRPIDIADEAGVMYGVLFEQSEPMRMLKGEMAVRLRESPLLFEHHHHQPGHDPLSVRWKGVGERTGIVTVIYVGTVVRTTLLIGKTSEDEERDGLRALEQVLLMHTRADPFLRLPPRDKRPLALRVRVEGDERFMPFDVAEWCLAAAFFEMQEDA
jgi:hypothetical protein